MTRAWWRRNAVPLGILVILLPASVASIGWYEWSATTAEVSDRTVAVIASDGETVELADATWGPIRSGQIDDTTGLTLPPGTKLLAAAVPVAPDFAARGDDPLSCQSPVLIQQSTGTQWKEMSSEIGLLYNPDEPLLCVSSAEEPYEMIVPFVVPEDVEGPFWVDVLPFDSAGSFVRFSIDP